MISLSLKKLYDPKSIVKPEEVQGELPTAKQAFGRVLDIAWPSIVEQLAVSLISSVDMVMVGSVGKLAINAVSISNQPKLICLAPVMALCTAITVLVARRKGQNRQEDAHRIVKVGFILVTLVALVSHGIVWIFARQVLSFAGASVNYIDDAVVYIRIVIIGQLFYSMGLALTSAQRGAGNTRISLITNVAANVVNVIFNYMLIGGHFGFPALGVKGAAIATSIGNVASFVLAYINIKRKNQFLDLEFRLKVDWKDLFSQLWFIWKSALVEQLFMRIGFFLFVKAVATLGDDEYSAHSVVTQIMNLSFAFGMGLQTANTSLVGQSLGAKRSDMALVYTRVSTTMGLMIGMALSLFYNLFAHQLCELFVKDPVVIELCRAPLIVLCIVVIFQIPQVITVGALRGAGDSKFIARLMFISSTFVRPGLTYLMAYPMGLGLIGAWLGTLIDQFFRLMISQMRYNKGAWKQIEV